MGEPARTMASTESFSGPTGTDQERLRALVDAHMRFVWRSLRRLGIPAPDADDLAQDVFVVASRRIATVAPESERSFLFGTALRLAAAWRRARRARGLDDHEAVNDEQAPGVGADEAIGERHTSVALGRALDGLPEELRVVFVLCDLDDMTMAQSAKALALPKGTVASRLRRARVELRERVQRMRLAGEL
jgi:RNA polymerase sigma-70 factor (ECF subfamily)